MKPTYFPVFASWFNLFSELTFINVVLNAPFFIVQHIQRNSQQEISNGIQTPGLIY